MSSYVGIAVFATLFLDHNGLVGRKDHWWRAADTLDLVSGPGEVEADEQRWGTEDELCQEQHHSGVNIMGTLGKFKAIWEKE